MKKTALGLVLLVTSIGLASAQGMMGPGPYGYGPQGGSAGQAQVAPVAKSLDGKLAFQGEYPVLQAKDKAYVIHMPRFYYYAYTDGIKAGDTIHVDGYELAAVPGSDKTTIQVTKATINGKTYDFTTGYGRGRGGMMGGYGQGGMMGGYGRGRR